MNHIDLSHVEVIGDYECWYGYILINNKKCHEIDLRTCLEIIKDCDNTDKEKLEFIKLANENCSNYIEYYFGEVVTNLFFYLYLYINCQNGTGRDFTIMIDLLDQKDKLLSLMHYYDKEDYNSFIVDYLKESDIRDYIRKAYKRFINLMYPKKGFWGNFLDGFEDIKDEDVDLISNNNEWTIEHLSDDNWFKENIINKYAKSEELRRY